MEFERKFKSTLLIIGLFCIMFGGGKFLFDEMIKFNEGSTPEAIEAKKELKESKYSLIEHQLAFPLTEFEITKESNNYDTIMYQGKQYRVSYDDPSDPQEIVKAVEWQQEQKKEGGILFLYPMPRF